MLNCENDDKLLACLKKINMKDVIYWIAEAWHTVPESTLRKAWCKILNVQFEENNETENNHNLVKYIKKIPG